jgi:hypothetical protein
MAFAVCDSVALEPLQRLVSGPFENFDELLEIERLVRTVVLHDEMTMVWDPVPYDIREKGKLGIVIRPAFNFQFILAQPRPQLSDIRAYMERVIALGDYPTPDDQIQQQRPDLALAPELVSLAAEYANAGAGNPHYEEHIRFLQHVFTTAQQGGSVLLGSPFGKASIKSARRYPEALFSQLDEDWRRYAKEAEENGFGLITPPVLGIVLSRTGRRDAIPAIIEDLRNEWADARRKVWGLLGALKSCRTLAEAQQIQGDLSDASKLFSPDKTDLDTRPVRVLWEIVAAGGAGASIAGLSGGKPAIGALTGALAQLGRSLPGFTHEFGAILFGRGAFDLARRVKRASSQVELGALSRLLSDPEKQHLGLS